MKEQIPNIDIRKSEINTWSTHINTRMTYDDTWLAGAYRCMSDMSRAVFIILLALSGILGCRAAEAGSATDRIEKILKTDGHSAEALIDSALEVIMTECIGDIDGFSEGEAAMKETIIPFMQSHADELSLFKRSEVYCQYAMLCGQQGEERFADTQAINDKALSLAREARDYYMMGFVYVRKAIFEDRYGETTKAFRFFNEAIANYRNAPENVNKEIVDCYFNQANIYLRMNDFDGIGHVIDGLGSYIASADGKHRDYMLYKLYCIKGVYFGHLHDECSSPSCRNAMRDSLLGYTSDAIRLVENSDDGMLRDYVDPVWLYYNQASYFVQYYDRPMVDSVEHYLAKMTERGLYVTDETKFEIHASQQQVRAEMWAKLGDYAGAEKILTALKDEIACEASTTKDLIHNKIDIFKALREISVNTGHYKEALAYTDSLNRLERQQTDSTLYGEIKDIEIKYKTQETELALAQSETRRANTLMWLFASAGLLLVGVIIFIVYAGRQRRRRVQKEMEFAALRADIGRQLTQQYVEGLENERQRMSRELHDGVCNDLLAIQMNINSGRPAESTAELIASCRESVRRISHELMPPEFSYASLDEVVRFFVAKQAEANVGKIAITYRSSATDADWGAVPDAVALEIYRIIQEGVGNAVRHSGATVIEVFLDFTGNRLEAVIRDNGLYRSSGRKGLGLESIRRRANSIGGNVDVVAYDKSGTEVRLNVKI